MSAMPAAASTDSVYPMLADSWSLVMGFSHTRPRSTRGRPGPATPLALPPFAAGDDDRDAGSAVSPKK